ncbi:MAG TPA: DEAD/DEAH box helicase, partial [Chitinophagaceae bacterium]|nr:DEAD/DEAH box helicase [Chitinophagaceae bacterium]
MNYDTSNEIFLHAVQLVNQSARNIFLTGKAGTGKTTFLKFIRENCPKQIAVVAPTGVAAINAGGVTIHSFFQLPLSPFIPETRATAIANKNEETVNKHSLPGRLRLTNEKKKVLQELELLIIDEISMVRCDTLDAIDTVLRHVRHRHSEQFGGVQILFIGDMYQLSPVIPDKEWQLLSQFYNSPYFFDSRVMKEQPSAYIEFNKIYRQSEEQFIRLLNQIRNNDLDAEGSSVLEKRFQPAFRHNSQEGYIILTTHNYKADAINAEELQKLKAKIFSFRAEITGEINEKSYPADELLQLKEGAQVMFIKNDAEKSKKYFNGKIGVVTKLNEKEIFVQCKEEPDVIEVKKETWENIRYTINKNSGKLEEEVLGSFTQYPLRLAWAITIHKSQGLTFEKAIIDAGQAFAAGQVYVAMSRCTNLNGLVLQSRIKAESLCCDERIVRFSQSNKSTGLLKEELEEASKSYQQDILVSLFDFNPVVSSCKELMKYLFEHKTSFNAESSLWIEEFFEAGLNLQKT